jgi:hydroxypyruvate isomerase
MKVSCCIDMMFSDKAFADRISSVAKCGLDAIEFWKWTNKDIDEVVKLKNKYNLVFVVFNIDSSDEKLSYDLSRGILNAGRVDDFLKALQESMPIYKRLNASAMIVLVGETISNMPREEQIENVYKCLKAAAPLVEANGITIVVEPLNDVDRQNYFMPYANDLMDILNRVDSPNIKMLYDIYHQHVMGDFSIDFIKSHIGRIGHFHVADFPGRREPGSATVNYVPIIKEINKTDYKGFIGLEYRATKPDSETFGFLREI